MLALEIDEGNTEEKERKKAKRKREGERRNPLNSIKKVEGMI